MHTKLVPGNFKQVNTLNSLYGVWEYYLTWTSQTLGCGARLYPSTLIGF
jgi:hypothetical protein